MNDADTKICPICKRQFTRKQLHLSRGQWFLRKYCSNKCYGKSTKQQWRKD